MKSSECDGACKEHVGQIKRVHVIDPRGYDWGEFFYCENAIKIDRERGMKVEEA